MIRLKKLLQEQMTSEKLRQYLSKKYLGDHEIEELIITDEGAALIANQFGETINTSKTPIHDPMQGAYSFVWWLQSGKVLKISSNPEEAYTGAYFSKRPKAQHVISYYDVREILFNGKATDLYAMITDGVTVLTPEQQLAYYKLFEQGLWADDIEMKLESNEVDPNAADVVISGRTRYTFEGAKAEFVKMLLSQRESVMKDINRFDVDWSEAHGNNVGFDQYGQFVIFDIWSDSGTQKGAYRRMNKSIDLLPLFKNFFDSTGTIG